MTYVIALNNPVKLPKMENSIGSVVGKILTDKHKKKLKAFYNRMDRSKSIEVNFFFQYINM